VNTSIVLTICNTIVPLFVIVFVGWWLAGRRLDAKPIGELAVGLAAPALIFTLFYRMDWESTAWVELAGGAGFIMGVTLLVSWLALRRVFSDPHRGLLMPVVFWNSGNMGLSVMRLAFGEEALSGGAVVFVTVATAQAVLGTAIAKGRGGLGEVLRMPLVHACWLGLGCSLLELRLPVMALEPIELIADMAIPLMLINLGMALRNLPITELGDAMICVVMRSGVGFGAALLFVSLFDVQGLPRQILIVSSVLPPAVISVLFAQRYDAAPRRVASAIVLGTLLSVVTVPLVLAWVL
jgi:predicted permease